MGRSWLVGVTLGRDKLRRRFWNSSTSSPLTEDADRRGGTGGARQYPQMSPGGGSRSADKAHCRRSPLSRPEPDDREEREREDIEEYGDQGATAIATPGPSTQKAKCGQNDNHTEQCRANRKEPNKCPRTQTDYRAQEEMRRSSWREWIACGGVRVIHSSQNAPSLAWRSMESHVRYVPARQARGATSLTRPASANVTRGIAIAKPRIRPLDHSLSVIGSARGETAVAPIGQRKVALRAPRSLSIAAAPKPAARSIVHPYDVSRTRPKAAALRVAAASAGACSQRKRSTPPARAAMVTATITATIDNEGGAPSLCIPHRYPGKVSAAARDIARVRRREAELVGVFIEIIVLAVELLSGPATLRRMRCW